MTYTGTSCGSKVRYRCTVGKFGGFEVDTCIRYLNATASKSCLHTILAYKHLAFITLFNVYSLLSIFINLSIMR